MTGAQKGGLDLPFRSHFRRDALQPDEASLHDIGVIRHPQGRLGILLDQEKSRSLAANIFKEIENRFHK